MLCRNIPQSAIKFFVFEQLMRTVHRRGCGGRRGFACSDFRGRGHRGVHSRDVHNPVRHNQDEIADEGGDGRGWRGGGGGVADDARHRRKGGRSGGYIGVTPRLFIYITQGAVFFTAYEITRMALLGYVSRDEDDGSEDAGTKARRR